MTSSAAGDQNGAAQWRLGQTSERYESGGRGPGAISSGRHDHGGASYGTYQLSSRTGTLREYLAQSRYGMRFDGLVPATAAFNAKWTQIARDDPAFAGDQHDFIRRSHYQVQCDRLVERGLDMRDRGPAVQDALWSTSVQFRNRTRRIFEAGLTEKFGAGYELSALSDGDIVTAVQEYKVNHNTSLFTSSPKLWPGLLARAQTEQTALLRLAAQHGDLRPAVAVEADSWVHAAPVRVGRGSSGDEVRVVQELLDALGYRDARGDRLRVDGEFGGRTEEALNAFQRAHGFKAVGFVGPKTQAALEAARLAGPTPVDPAHPDHALRQQVSVAVDAMERSLGRTPDAGSERVKASLLVAARERGLARIDHVVLGAASGMMHAGQNVFAIQARLDDPASRRVHVPTQQALATPVDASFARLEQLEAMRQALPSRQAAQGQYTAQGEYGAGLRRFPSP